MLKESLSFSFAVELFINESTLIHQSQYMGHGQLAVSFHFHAKAELVKLECFSESLGAEFLSLGSSQVMRKSRVEVDNNTHNEDMIYRNTGKHKRGRFMFSGVIHNTKHSLLMASLLNEMFAQVVTQLYGDTMGLVP